MNKLCLIMSGLFLLGCEQPQPRQMPARPALVLTVGEKTLASPTVLIGEIRSRYETPQGFRIGGKIIKRYVDVGAGVKKGQILAKLDNQDTGLTAKAAQAQVQSAQADLALARAELDRVLQLYQRQFISKQAVDIQEAKLKSAEALVKQNQAQAAVSDNQSAYTDLRAEREGVVTEIRAEPGQVVAAGEAVVRIAIPEEREVAIVVPESRMQGIEINTPAEVRLWAEPAQLYEGKVREVAPAADSITRTFQVRVALPDADNKVRLGMTAAVRFYNKHNQELLLPLPALTQHAGETVVWVVNPENDQVQPRKVQTGMFREDGVIIIQGLQTGEQVVVAGVHTLVPGQLVRPVQAQHNP